MGISEAIKQGYDTLTHPSFGGNSRVVIHVADKEAGRFGPWAKVHDDATDSGALEPQTVFVLDLPQDGQYEPYEPSTPSSTKPDA